jgi:hypothetical protein
MKISKAHQLFADFIQLWYTVPKQDVLNYPEKYLGPNWEAVINFWLYLDTLTKDQLKVVGSRYLNLSDEQSDIAGIEVWDAAKDTTIYFFDSANVTYCAYCNVSYNAHVLKRVTYELIGLDKLLDKGYKPLFFPLILF